MNQISKKYLKAADLLFATLRAQYVYLVHLGYSQAQIAGAYNISKRAVWQAIHSAATPREQGILDRYRVRVGGR